MALTKVPLTLLDSPGTSGNVLTSDGTTWTSAAAAGTLTGQTIIWGTQTAPSGYLKCDGTIYNKSSYSALATALGSLPVITDTYAIAGIGGNLSLANNNVIYSYANGLKYSSNQGASYTTLSIASFYSPTKIVWNGTYYVAASTDGCNTVFFYSTNLSSWTTVVGGTADYADIAASGSTVVLLRNQGQTYYTTNGTSWAAGGTALGTSSASAIVSNNAGTFVAVGRNAANTSAGIATSTNNGVTWTFRTVPSNMTTGYVYSVTWQNSFFIAVDQYGNVGSSLDGITWTAKGNCGLASQIQYLSAIGLYYANQKYSSDLINWYQLPASPASSISLYTNTLMVNDGTFIYNSNGTARAWKPFVYNTSTQFIVPNFGGNASGNVAVAGAYYYIKT